MPFWLDPDTPNTQDQYLALLEQAIQARELDLNEAMRLDAVRFARQCVLRPSAEQFGAYREGLL